MLLDFRSLRSVLPSNEAAAAETLTLGLLRSNKRYANRSCRQRHRSLQRLLPPPERWPQIIQGLNTQIGQLETELANHFDEHPDADIYLSLPGLGVILGARVLAEFGDDPERYNSAKSRRNYAGTSPLTIASGRKHAVVARYVRNRRLYDAIDKWAFASLRNSPGCRAFYDQRRAAGDLHHQALRALGHRLVGYLHGCLRARTHYNEHTAWAHRNNQHQLAA